MNKKYFLIINYIFAACVLFMLFKNIDISGLTGWLYKINYYYISAAVVVSLFYRIIFYPWLWQKVFKESGLKIKYKDVFTVNAASLPLKYAMPFKINEVIRAAGLKIVSNIDFSLALGAVLFLRLLILSAIVFIFLAGSVLMVHNQGILWSAAGFAVIGICFIILKNLPEKLFGMNVSSLKHCIVGTSFNQKQNMFLWSVFMQAGEIVSSYFILRAFDVSLSFPVLIYSISFVMLCSMVPFSVQGIGIREAAAVFVLGNYISNPIGLAVGVFITFVHHIIPALAGGLIWVFYSLSKMIFLNNKIKTILYKAVGTGFVFLFLTLNLCASEVDIQNLSSPDARVRRMAVNNLRQSVQSKEVESSLINLLNTEQDALTRIQILQVISITGSQDARKAVIALQEDPVLEVRKTAVTLTTGFSGGQDITAALKKIIDNPNEDESLILCAMDALSLRENSENILEKAAASKNKKIRDAALSGLHKSALYGNKKAGAKLNQIEKNTKDVELKKSIRQIKKKKG